MKKLKIVLTILFAFLTINATNAQQESFYGIGAALAQDPVTKKIFVFELLDSSAAKEAGIKEGDEIIAVDGLKIKNATLSFLTSIVRGEKDTSVRIRIKRNFFYRKTFTINRALVTYSASQPDECFYSHWRQVAPKDMAFEEVMPKKMTDKFSLKYKFKVLPKIKYWSERKEAFNVGYRTCQCKYSQQNKETCLINLVNREVSKTNTDKMVYRFLR